MVKKRSLHICSRGGEDRKKDHQCENLYIVEIFSSKRCVRNSKRTREYMEHGDITASEERFEQYVISIRHAEEEWMKCMDGELNEAGDENESCVVCDVEINELTEINGRILLENADVFWENEIISCLINGKDLYSTEEIESFGGHMRELLQSMFMNMMEPFDSKIEPPITVVS